MPNPKKNEAEKDYMSRCISQIMHEGKITDNKQAVAICYSMFRRGKRGKNFLSVGYLKSLEKNTKYV